MIIKIETLFSDKRQSEYAFGFSNVLYQMKKCDDGFELKQIKILSGYIQETIFKFFGGLQYRLNFILGTLSTLAIVFLRYRVATKIEGYFKWLVSQPLEVSKLVYLWLEGWSYFPRFSRVWVLTILYRLHCIDWTCQDLPIFIFF